MFTFKQGDLNTIMLSVLRLTGTVPTFPADYTNPQLRISHVNGGGEIEDLAFTNMIQTSGNQWHYKYTIPAEASFTKYLVTFKAQLDGQDIQTTEEFRVVPEEGSEAGSGEFSVELTFKNQTTNVGIDGVVVRVYDKSNPSVAIAQAVSDENGKVFLFLNEGEYIVSVQKTGVISETHTLVVNSDGSHSVSGD